MFSLEGRKAVVTGATGGIGEAIAKALINQGAEVMISGTREEKLAQLAAQLGEKAHYKACNLSNAEDITEFMSHAEKTLGGIDILINNAGITKDGLFMRMKDEDWEKVIEVNLTSAMRLSRAAIRGMMKQRFGRIISVSSVVGVMGNAGQVNYAASKAGLIGMSKSLAREVANRGITVNTIAPGYISTPMTDALNEEQRDAIAKNIPANRLGGSDEVAACVCYLASNEAGYVTGETMHVNGGLIMV